MTLRAPEMTDVDMLYRLENDMGVRSVSWGPAPVSRQMVWDYVKNYVGDICRDGQLRLVIDIDGEAVGEADIYDFDSHNSRAMIGIAIEEGRRGQGIGLRALGMVVDYCRDVLGLHQLACLVPRGNEASLTLFSSLGFKTSGCLRSWLRRGKKYEDAIVMQLLFP